jgi:hypothetical protein
LNSIAVRAMEPVYLLDCDPGRFRYSSWRNLTIGVWANQATGEAAQRIQNISRLMGRNHPRGHSSVVFVLDGAPPPTPEASAIFSKMYDTKRSGIVCMGIVVEGGGFWASAIRSSITGLRMSQPGGLRMGVSDTLDQVLDWFPAEHSQRTGVPMSALELRTALLTAREVATNDNGERPLMTSIGSE